MAGSGGSDAGSTALHNVTPLQHVTPLHHVTSLQQPACPRLLPSPTFSYSTTYIYYLQPSLVIHVPPTWTSTSKPCHSFFSYFLLLSFFLSCLPSPDNLLPPSISIFLLQLHVHLLFTIFISAYKFLHLFNNLDKKKGRTSLPSLHHELS